MSTAAVGTSSTQTNGDDHDINYPPPPPPPAQVDQGEAGLDQIGIQDWAKKMKMKLKSRRMS
jgi:hypothetical protein